MSTEIIQLLVIGLVAGIAGGMFGIGGGAIMVPAMVLLMGMDQKFATGTSTRGSNSPDRDSWRRSSISAMAISTFEMPF